VTDPIKMLVHARVATMQAGASMNAALADAIAWQGDRLIATGARAEVEARLDRSAPVERHDVNGATVLPGFIDAHHHASVHALYGGAVRLVAPEVTNIESLQRALARASSELGPGEWLVATDWDELLLAERRPPTLRELDDAVPDRPLVALHYSCHRALANGRALEAAGITRDTPSPSGGQIARGPDRVPNGLLIERGMSRVESLARASLVARDAEGFIARLVQHHRALVAAGITYLCDATVPADIGALYREAERRGVLIVPTTMLPVSTAGCFEPPWDVLDGPQATGADADAGRMLSVGPVKLIFDGAPGCSMCLTWWQAGATLVDSWMSALRDRSFDSLRTAMSLKPRFERSGREVRTGIAIYRREEARAIVKAAHERGRSAAIHAIGNEAVDVALDAFDARGAGALSLARIEHATFLDRSLVDRIAGGGVVVVAQPHFLTLPAIGSAPSIPALRNTPLRWLLDAGVVVAGSSDYPVAGFAPLDAVRSAVFRHTSRGRVLEPDQCTTLDEALAMYTRASAEACGVSRDRGTLEAGKRADLIVLDRALATTGDLERARVRATFVGGRQVYGAALGGSAEPVSGAPGTSR
jgi:predicted amidohydrolase YtcJ